MPARLTPDEIDQKAAELEVRAAGLRAVAKEARRQGLRSLDVDGIVSKMNAAGRLAISEGRAKGEAQRAGKKAPDAFLASIRAAGYTLRSLAEKLEVDPSLLTRWRQPKGGRWIPLAKAEEIERLIGYQATRENWGGRIG